MTRDNQHCGLTNQRQRQGAIVLKASPVCNRLLPHKDLALFHSAASPVTAIWNHAPPHHVLDNAFRDAETLRKFQFRQVILCLHALYFTAPPDSPKDSFASLTSPI